MDSVRKHRSFTEFELSEKINSMNPSKQSKQLQTSATLNATPDHQEFRLPEIESEVRSFDLVVFGATGAVGRFVVEEMALVLAKDCSPNDKGKGVGPTNQQSPCRINNELNLTFTADAQSRRRQSVPRPISQGVRWAVAGRSSVRLSETLCRAELYTGTKDLSLRVPMILADLNHQRSLIRMCSKTNLVVNCAGPFAADGEALVKACLEARTNYIDLCHETTFIEQIRRKYSTQARQACIYIINGCGFQSMSAEMGLNFTKKVVDGRIEEVKIILNLSESSARIRPKSQQLGGPNFHSSHCGIITCGMWQSLLIDKAQEISPSANKCAGSVESIDDKADDDGQIGIRKPPLERKDTQTLVKDIVEFQNRNSLVWLELFNGFGEKGQGYCLPISSVTGDETQLVRGEMANYEIRKPDLASTMGWRPVRCTSFLSFRSLKMIVIAMIWLLLFNFLVRFPYTRRFMSWFPYISSFGNVKTTKKFLDRTSLSHIRYCQTFLAYGSPGDDPAGFVEDGSKQTHAQLLVSRVIGPEPNHIATATFVVQAALSVIVERDHLPIDAGVMTPGVAFAETNIIYQLRKRNIKFEVMKKL